MSFNPNELILEKIRAVEEYNPSTKELTGRYTQIEEPSLKTSAEGTQVTDAMGSEIVTFYNAQTGTFSFTNSLFSLDLAASQLGTEKTAGTADKKLKVPVSETPDINPDGTVKLKYVPAGPEGAEIKSVRIINDNNTFGEKYEVSPTAAAGKFTLDAEHKTITLPAGVTGRAFVQYERESANAVQITKKTDGVPEVKSLLIHAIFHDPCDTNLVYAGVISVPRAQINPEAVEISLSSEGKHAAEYKLQKSYCDSNARLFDIIVAVDEEEEKKNDETDKGTEEV
ncbi:MAG: hypothetical protein HFG35_09285 [Eubacterium sp.]|jgi:hypothetical protein|nr:hypothetical protein [Eubacterium sp.]